MGGTHFSRDLLFTMKLFPDFRIRSLFQRNIERLRAQRTNRLREPDVPEKDVETLVGRICLRGKVAQANNIYAKSQTFE